MEQWNGGIVEQATMTNDPVPHHLFVRAHYASQLEQSQTGEREEQVRDVDLEKDREAKAAEHMLIVQLQIQINFNDYYTATSR